MRAPAPGEHEGLTGVTFDSGRRANHSFAWHRAALRDLVAGWLDEVDSH